MRYVLGILDLYPPQLTPLTEEQAAEIVEYHSYIDHEFHFTIIEVGSAEV